MSVDDGIRKGDKMEPVKEASVPEALDGRRIDKGRDVNVRSAKVSLFSCRRLSKVVS